MKVAIGTTVLAAGTAGGEPARLVSASGEKQVQVSLRLRSASAAVYGRGNAAYADVIEADYSYETPALAQAGAVSLRTAALAATGSLVYGEGGDAVTLGPAEVRSVQLVEWSGCGITMRYDIIAVEA